MKLQGFKQREKIYSENYFKTLKTQKNNTWIYCGISSCHTNQSELTELSLDHCSEPNL